MSRPSNLFYTFINVRFRFSPLNSEDGYKVKDLKSIYRYASLFSPIFYINSRTVRPFILYNLLVGQTETEFGFTDFHPILPRLEKIGLTREISSLSD